METTDLLETWIQSKGRHGRVKQIETTFDLQWIRDARDPYIEQTPQIGRARRNETE